MLTYLVSPLSFLKNPMMLMGVFTLIMVFGMPYLMDNSMHSQKPADRHKTD